LMTGAPAPAADYAAFFDSTPDWPDRAILRARFQQALATENDPDTLARLCPNSPLTQAGALVRCGSVLGTGPMTPIARQAWAGGMDSASDEAAFLTLYASVLTPADQTARFQRQVRTGQFAAASRQIDRLRNDEQAAARARVALRSRAPDADEALAAVGASSDPLLLLDRLFWLRRTNRADDALSLWKSAGFQAQAAQPLVFAAERAAFARSLVTAERYADAAAMADDRTIAPQTPAGLEAAFTSGWLRLEKLGDPAAAADRFALVAQSPALISRSRGLYWLGRAREA
ncbi:lytic transglycosylase domain-containing protein, partial [Ameyamaea chiangmaiensis]|nr:lytic transglycosylase domain-containing protein [Ameyamaea chiangmaiensis]